METIYISDSTTSFYLARWLFLKKKITQAEMYELSKKPRYDVIQVINDYDIIVKYRNEKEKIYEPSDSQLFD